MEDPIARYYTGIPGAILPRRAFPGNPEPRPLVFGGVPSVPSALPSAENIAFGVIEAHFPIDRNERTTSGRLMPLMRGTANAVVLGIGI
jgi:hypothetical protein